MEWKHKGSYYGLLLYVTSMFDLFFWTYGVDDVRYVGCYKFFYKGNEALRYSFTSAYGSVDKCISACIRYGYNFAGQKGGHCRCDHTLMDYGGDESQCTFLCPNNQTQICGSDDEKWISVFRAECTTSYYGIQEPACSYKCGQCAHGQQCDINDGACPAGCVPGYWGTMCTNQCNNCYRDQCDINNGACLSGCKEGWDINPWCNVCKPGYWGPACNWLCGYCAGNQQCDVISGHCPEGCDDGYWGLDCRSMCGHCARNVCDKLNGCQHGCQDGWGNTPMCNTPVTLTTITTTTKPDSPYYIGCHRITGKMETTKYNAWDVEGCISWCIIIRATNAALHQGGDCYCGASNYLSQDESKCTAACRGNPEQKCGAPSGDYYSLYTAVCPGGFWGISPSDVCKNQCGHCAANLACSFTDGTCKSGCEAGWEPPYCINQATNNNMPSTNPDIDDRAMDSPMHKGLGQDKPKSNIPLIVGLIVGFIILLLIVLLIIVVLLKKRPHLINKTIKSENVESGNMSSLTAEPKARNSKLPFIMNLAQLRPRVKIIVRDKEQVIDGYTNLPLSNPISLENLQQYVQQHMSFPEPFKEEYAKIPRTKDYPHKTASNAKLKEKNRFKDILPYDDSLVKLSIQNNDPLSGYINASFIQGFSENQMFIAAQGPNKCTLNDFWRMIWEHDITTVVMLTNMIENGKVKCNQYWPDNGSVSFGELLVNLEKTEVFQDFTIRKLILTKGVSSRHVTQFHFTSWPDHGVPQHAVALLNFHQKVNSEICQPNKESPVLVHCSAGVGRTGAYLAIDFLLQQAREEAVIDVMKVTSMMRESRPKMLQTREQYAFVYNTLLEAIWVGVTLIPCFQFSEVYDEMLAPDPYSISSKLEEQYKKLESIRPQTKSKSSSVASSSQNKNKNRSLNLLPANDAYARLMTTVDGRSDYINAVFVDGRKHKNKFLVTQLPLPDTVIDFWRLVFDYKCPCIVGIFKEAYEDEDVYWPSQVKPMELGPLTVKLDNEVKSEGNIQERHFTVINTKRDKSHSLTHLCYSGWPTEGNIGPKPAQELFQLFLKAQQTQALSEGPTLVHCMDGVEESGVFLALSNLCDMMNVEQELDVFHVVQEIRKNRSQFITSQEQYWYLYEAAAEYMDSFSTYSNFR